MKLSGRRLKKNRLIIRKPLGRETFRKSQDLEREKYRKELQERGSSKKIKVIKWWVASIVLVIFFYFFVIGLINFGFGVMAGFLYG